MRLVSGPSPRPCRSRAVQCEKFQGPRPHGKLWPPKTRAATSPKLSWAAEREAPAESQRSWGSLPQHTGARGSGRTPRTGCPKEPDEAGVGESTVRSSLDLTPGRAALRLRAHRLRSLGGSWVIPLPRAPRRSQGPQPDVPVDVDPRPLPVGLTLSAALPASSPGCRCPSTFYGARGPIQPHTQDKHLLSPHCSSAPHLAARPRTTLGTAGAAASL